LPKVAGLSDTAVRFSPHNVPANTQAASTLLPVL
jgi:hypothetical protein